MPATHTRRQTGALQALQTRAAANRRRLVGLDVVDKAWRERHPVVEAAS